MPRAHADLGALIGTGVDLKDNAFRHSYITYLSAPQRLLLRLFLSEKARLPALLCSTMTESDTASRDRHTARWTIDDMTFAAAQLGQEFPALEKGRVFAAVNSAAPFVAPEEGRVKLMRRARELLRPVGT